MNLVYSIFMNLFPAIVVVVILCYYINNNTMASLHNKIFVVVSVVTVCLLIIDCIGRLDGHPDTIYPVLNKIGNFLLFALYPILPSLWILFIDSYVNQSEKFNKKIVVILLIFNGLNIISVILSQFYGWYYIINTNNIYIRGPYFHVAAFFLTLLLICASLLILVNYKKLDARQFWAFQSFSILPMLSVILHFAVYGYSLILNGVAISILIVFLYIQNLGSNLDYLTGIYNRKMLEIFLLKRINSSTVKKSFSAIMIDLDNFKYINDTFGHKIGDETLQTTARLLKSCLRSKDIITRYGGDEFCIILDVSDYKSLEIIVARIHSTIEKYNETSNSPFKLGLSMGYSVYESNSNLSSDEFQNKIDKLMYINKNVDKIKVN